MVNIKNTEVTGESLMANLAWVPWLTYSALMLGKTRLPANTLKTNMPALKNRRSGLRNIAAKKKAGQATKAVSTTGK